MIVNHHMLYMDNGSVNICNVVCVILLILGYRFVKVEEQRLGMVLFQCA